MGDGGNEQAGYGTSGVFTTLSGMTKVDDGKSIGVGENENRAFETKAMLGLIARILCFIPLEIQV